MSRLTAEELRTASERLKAKRRVAGPGQARSRPAGPLPLSFAQERLWFLDRLTPGSAVYNLPVDLELIGRLDRAALYAALAAVVDRHEVLRTVFPATDGRPEQRIAPPRGAVDQPPPRGAVDQPPLVDLSGLPPARRRPEALALAAAEAVRSFDLARGPLLRATLLALGDDAPGARAAGAGELHLALLTLHHTVADAWSLSILVRELGATYAALAGGAAEAPAAPPLRWQYADFALWQRSWLAGDVLASQLGWWRHHLEGAPPELDLPADRPRPPVPDTRGAELPMAVAPPLAARVAALCKAQGVTLFMVLLAVFAALLARLAGQDDVVIGMPVAGRNQAELEPLIGFFVNTLALRLGGLRGRSGDGFADRSGGGLTALLARAREATLGALAHQDLPFEKLVEELHPERSLARNPIFQVALSLQNAPVDTLTLPGLSISPLAGIDRTAGKFDLTLNLGEGSRGLAGAWQYAPALFDAATVARLGRAFETLLAAALAAPERPLAELPLLAAAERHQLVVEWGGAGPAERAGAPERRITADLAAWAAATPSAPAVFHDGGEVAYGELERLAGGLAGRLRRLGVGPEVRVGLCLASSVGLVVAVRAVLAAGGAFVPLDPGYPAARLSFLAADAGVGLLIATVETLASLPAEIAGRVPVLLVDATTGEMIATGAQEELEPELTVEPVSLLDSADEPLSAALDTADESITAALDSAAYVIYTSGSTGRPKGVVVPRRGLGDRMRDMASRFGLGPGRRMLQFASPSFDAAVAEILAPLCSGAAVVLAPRRSLVPGPEVIARLRAQRVTCASLAPSVLAALSDLADTALPELETLVTVGEACPLELARRWAPGRRLLNAYGPTEAIVCATTAELGGVLRQPPPIGRPLPGVTALVLDGSGRPVPAGVVGELHLGGSGLARGYLGRPETTAERFVPNPWGGPGERLYRTGDLVRWLAAGELAFLGRADHQVKVRGHRIEPGEVEAAVTACAGVRQAAVVLRDDLPAGRGLVAFLVAEEGAILSAGTVREFIKQRLPDFMLPAQLVLLPALPLTANGKVDRAALAAVELGAQARARGEHVAPRNPIEEMLAEIWAELLGLPQVGVHDDFFDLGGHSLQGIRLMARIGTTLGVDLPVRVVFEAPTVARLAVAVAVEMERCLLEADQAERFETAEADSTEREGQSG